MHGGTHQAQLRERPDDATLAVYADLLMSEGDPRGEQIALELRRPERRPLLLRWLASHLQTEPGGDHLHAFDEEWIPFLRSPIGEFCRGVSGVARMENARALVDALIEKPRPFLTRFKLTAGFDGPLVLDERHVAAMPNLVELDIDGDYDLRRFRHPRVTKLRRASWSMNGLRSWVWPLDLPNCEELVVDAKPWSKRVDAADVTFDGLPRVRVLDVSECERKVLGKQPGDRVNLDVFAWLRDLPMITRLERVRVPSVGTSAQAMNLATLVARAPGLRVDVAHVHALRGGARSRERARALPGAVAMAARRSAHAVEVSDDGRWRHRRHDRRRDRLRARARVRRARRSVPRGLAHDLARARRQHRAAAGAVAVRFAAPWRRRLSGARPRLVGHHPPGGTRLANRIPPEQLVSIAPA